MRTPSQKNILSTSFSIDLSTIDRKVDKLVRYLKNCDIDLKDDGKNFINFQPTYKTVINSLDRRKYKENLSTLVNNIYLNRFTETKAKLIKQGLMRETDMLLPQPLDDFGSRFDAFAATNTDPNNAILIALGTNPYKDLKVDIFEETEIKTYLNNIATASYDFNNLNFLLTNLDSITYTYVNFESGVSANYEISSLNYSKEIKEKILSIKSSVSASNPDEQKTLYNLVEKIPNLSIADNLIFSYLYDLNDASKNKIFPDNNMQAVMSAYPAQEIASVIGEKLFKDQTENTGVMYDVKIIEVARIKLIDYLIRTEIKKSLQEKLSSISFLNDFQSKYTHYNFIEEKLYSISNPEQSVNIKKENLFFRITFLRQTEQVILEQRQQVTSNLNIEFTNKQFLKFESPFGSIDKSNKFVAIIGGSDISQNQSSFDFFNPTILSILSDINYIDSNIFEIDPFYCPTPQSLDERTRIEREKYQNDQIIQDASPLTKNKNFVNSNPDAFNYINFPSLYFIPNNFPDAISFYEPIKTKLSRNMAQEMILQNSKYYYESSADTPSAALIRDPNSNEMFREALLNNGFYGLYEAKRNSFSDSVSIEQAINKLTGSIQAQVSGAISQVQDIIFAKTNLSCLLKEFQTCFLPKIGNCRDILRGFRFSELENIFNKAFPESLYAEMYRDIIQFKIDNIKDEREKRLLEEIRDLEKAIQNNERKRIVFAELDKRAEPGEALDIADRTISSTIQIDTTLQQTYQAKLKQYKDLKLEQESAQQNALDKIKARKEMQSDELKMIDDFLDLVETKYGINTDILCNIVDLFNISPMLFSIQLPQLPEIDIFQDLKLSLDLTIVQIIFDSVVAFIIKILQELLSCGGIKNIIGAALTGEAEGSITGAAFAAANQLVRGNFDLDDFISENPQIDPVAYAKSFANIANTLNPPLAIQEASGLQINADLGSGRANLSSRTRTLQVLSLSKSSATTEVEIQQSLTILISELSKRMSADAFMRLFDKPTDGDIKQVEQHIRQNRQELSYLLVPGALSGIFTYLGSITGLDSVRQELVAMSTFYASNSLNTRNVVCLDPISPVLDIDRGLGEEPPELPESVISPEDTYRNLLQDLLSASPDKLKNKLEESVFKPLLIGKLPNGKKIESVERAKLDIINYNLKDISKKFKAGCNDFYSNLASKKPFKRRVMRFLIQEGAENPREYENSEFKDLINKGGFLIKEDGTPDVLKDENGKEYIEIEEQKFVYGGLFTDNFYGSSNSLEINSTPEEFKITLTGSKGYESTTIKQANAPLSGSSWKIESILSNNENKINIYEGNNQEQKDIKFTFKINNQNIDTNSLYGEILNSRQEFKNLLKESIIDSLILPTQRISENQEFESKFEQYSSNSYEQFLKLIYEKITKAISEDGLLKPINLDSLQKEKYITNIKNGLDSIFPMFSTAIQTNSLPPMVSPNVDTPLKYINFCPKPTKQQRDLKIDPGLFGQLELQQFILQIMDERSNDLTNLDTLEEMFKDKDNLINFSLIDGMYLSLIRTACAEICFRGLFPLRVFNYNKKLIDDLLLPTYIAETVFKEIEYVSNLLNKKSLFELAQKHIDYIHTFIFSEEIEKPENIKLFRKIKQLKKEILSLEEDQKIINSYLGKLYVQKNTLTNENYQNNQDYKKKIENYISCLEFELKNKYNEVLLLQIRNIAYNELIVMFDKLSYLTSTNEKVKQELGNECADIDQNLQEKEFLSVLIPELLIKTELNQITTDNTTVETFIRRQEEKFKTGANLIIEHFINVPNVKPQFTDLYQRQYELNCYNVQTFEQFEKLIANIPDSSILNSYFIEEITYGMRIVYAPDTQLKQETSINFDFDLDDRENRGKITENINSLRSAGKNKFWLNGMLNHFDRNLNDKEKTYAIPFMGPQSSEGSRRFGLINVFPIIKETQTFFSAGINTVLDMKQLLPLLKNGDSNKLTDSLKVKISCNEKLKQLYSIFTNDNLLSNLTILSSMQILSDDKVIQTFKVTRKIIINNIFSKMLSIYNNDELSDFFEKLSSIEFFKDFNADVIPKILLKASIYVLQYYCQMTDPNINLALLIRNAVKLSLSAASQIPNPFGGPTIPSELPLALSPLAIYSMAQLPITVFGIPPAGIGVGPPLTVPGMILLGADLLLLSLEFSENFDSNIENEKIKEELRNYCFDLSGYKKYGV
jgi:hypothetical protein